MEVEDPDSRWASLNQDVLERIGRELPLRDLLSARLSCRQWRQHVAAAVTHLPHPHQQQHHHLVELDAQPPGQEDAWHISLTALAACLPLLSELMIYVSSRVSMEQLSEQLRSLPRSLPGLTKLELRYIVPSSVPCLGTSLQQLQPALTALTSLDTLYLIMGSSPEPAEVSAVLPALPALRDLKLLSGLPQYGLTNAKLEALGCATQLQRLHLEVSGVGQVDAGLAALSRLGGLRQLWLDGLVTLGPAVVCALQQLPELQELKLELDNPHHIPDLFALAALTRLCLTYHGDELDDIDDPPPGDVANGSGTDWDALERLVRGHVVRPVLCELGLLCCSFPSDPLPRLALLTSLTLLTFYDCRWTAAVPALAAAAALAVAQQQQKQQSPALGGSTLAAAVAAPLPPGVPRLGSWGVLTSLTKLQSFGMAQCVVPPIGELDLAALAAAWPGVTSLQLQSTVYPTQQLLQLQPQPARFGAFLSCWRRLESLNLSGSWCNDPRVGLDVSLLPPSLTSLVVSSVTLIKSAAARAAVFEALGIDIETAATGATSTLRPGCGGAPERGEEQKCEDGARLQGPPARDGSGISAAQDSDRRGPLGWAHTSGCRHTGSSIGSGSSSRGSVHDRVGGSEQSGGAPTLDALEHLVLGEVRLGPGVSLRSLVEWAPNLRSLEINNLLPNLTDDSCTALAALTALTVLRVSQDQEPEGHEARTAPRPGPAAAGQRDIGHGDKEELQACGSALSGMGLAALTGLRRLRQLEWLPWGCEPLGLVHVEALAHLRRLHLVTLRGARDGAIADAALEALRERLPLCDIDDTEWSGLVDV